MLTKEELPAGKSFGEGIVFFVARAMTEVSSAEQGLQASPRKTKQALSLAIKLVLTIACFWYISTKIDFRHAIDTIKSAKTLPLIASVLLYVLSKGVSAYRLNIYFQTIGVHLPHKQNLRLYWLGMFYNLFLPGAISGDAYKVVLLRKHYDASYKQLTAAVLLDRVSGLLGLGIILCVVGLFLFEPPAWKVVFAVAPFVAIAGYYFIIRRFFNAFEQSFVPTLLMGLAVQAIQVVGVYLILLAVGRPALAWLFIFLAGQMVTVLPISLGGGLGTREVVFAEGARYFGLNPGLGVAISLLFYLTSVVASIGGLWYVFKSPFNSLR